LGLGFRVLGFGFWGLGFGVRVYVTSRMLLFCRPGKHLEGLLLILRQIPYKRDAKKLFIFFFILKASFSSSARNHVKETRQPFYNTIQDNLRNGECDKDNNITFTRQATVERGTHFIES
jgi:hypothetical protein